MPASSPLRELVAEIRIKLRSSDIANVLKTVRQLKQNIAKQVSTTPAIKVINIDKKVFHQINEIRASFKSTFSFITKNAASASKKASSSLSNIAKTIRGLKRQFSAFNTILKFTGIGLAVLGVKKLAESMFDLFKNTGKEVRELEDLALTTGLNEDLIEAFGFGIEKAGGSLESARSSLVNFNKMLGEAQDGSAEAQYAFHRAGISINEELTGKPIDAVSALKQLQAQMKSGHLTTERLNRITDLFGGAQTGLVAVLKGEMGSFSELQRRLQALGGTYSSLTKRESKDLLNSFVEFDYMFKGIKSTLLSAVLPSINKFINRIKALYIANKDIINQNISQAFESLFSFIENPDEFFNKIKDSFNLIMDTFREANQVLNGMREILEGLGIIKPKISMSDYMSSIYHPGDRIPNYQDGGFKNPQFLRELLDSINFSRSLQNPIIEGIGGAINRNMSYAPIDNSNYTINMMPMGSDPQANALYMSKQLQQIRTNEHRKALETMMPRNETSS